MVVKGFLGVLIFRAGVVVVWLSVLLRFGTELGCKWILSWLFTNFGFVSFSPDLLSLLAQVVLIFYHVVSFLALAGQIS